MLKNGKKEVKLHIVSGRVTAATKRKLDDLQTVRDRSESYLVNEAIVALLERKDGKRHG